MVFLAVVADDDEPTNPTMCQQCLIDGEVGQILFDREPLTLIQGDARLHRIQHGSRIAGVVGERVWWKARWEMITHDSTVTDCSARLPQRSTVCLLSAPTPGALRCGRNQQPPFTR